MISLEQAKADGFRISTKEELRAYLEELNVPVSQKESGNYQLLLSKLLTVVGMVANGAGPKPTQRRVPDSMNPSLGENSIVPPYNLRLDRGNWEGRRHRVTLNKGDDTPKREKMRRFTINDYVCEMTYGEPTSIPEPFWFHLRDTETAEPRPHSEYDGNHLVRTTTMLVPRPAFNYSHHGVDPETADRAGNLQEWYYAKGEDWFSALNPQQTLRVAKELDVRTVDLKTGLPFSHSRVLSDVFVAVFSEAPISLGGDANGAVYGPQATTYAPQGGNA